MDEKTDMGWDEMQTAQVAEAAPRQHRKRVRRSVGDAALGVFDTFLDSVADAISIVMREFTLFLGTALVLIGLLGFSSDKFCDGNTADYLSCTRPNAYYYYDWFHITLVVIGVFFVMIWFLRRRNEDPR